MKSSFVFYIIVALFLSCCQKKSDSTISPSFINNNLGKGKQFAVSSIVSYSQSQTMSFESIKLMVDKSVYNDKNSIKALIRFDVTCYKVVYTTEDYDEKPISASGSLLLPKTNSSEPLPIVSIHHGTMVGDNELSSSVPGNHAYVFAGSGYITLVPDYLGFGASKEMQQPYFINKCSASAINDLIISGSSKAKDLGINNNGNVFLIGFSQGGNTTVASLKKIQESKPNGFNFTVKAAVSASGALCLRDQLNYLFKNTSWTGTQSGYSAIATATLSLAILGIEKNIIRRSSDMSYYFSSPYNANLPLLLNGSYNFSQATLELATGMQYKPQVFNPFFPILVANGTDVNFNRVIDENTLHNWGPEIPLRLYNGDKDIIIPYSNTEKAFYTMKNLSKKGAVKLYKINNGAHDHTTSDVIFYEGLRWFSNCKSPNQDCSPTL